MLSSNSLGIVGNSAAKQVMVKQSHIVLISHPCIDGTRAFQFEVAQKIPDCGSPLIP